MLFGTMHKNESCVLSVLRMVHAVQLWYNISERGVDMALSETKKKSNDRYLSKFKTLSVRFNLEMFAEIERAASGTGQSLQAYILQAVAERMEKEKSPD